MYLFYIKMKTALGNALLFHCKWELTEKGQNHT